VSMMATTGCRLDSPGYTLANLVNKLAMLDCMMVNRDCIRVKLVNNLDAVF